MAFVIVVSHDGSEHHKSPVFESILDSPDSLTYPAKSCTQYSNGGVRIWTYDRNSMVPENENVVDSDGVYIGVGCAILQNEGVVDVKSVFNAKETHPEAVQGDYLILGLDSNGNGGIYSTTMTFCPLFHHKAENHDVFSTDLGLLNRCLRSRIGKKTGVFFDSNYIYESIENEWGTREFPERTMFADIQRVLTTTQYKFENFAMLRSVHVIQVSQVNDFNIYWFDDNITNFNSDSLFVEVEWNDIIPSITKESSRPSL
ncbi:MAG: hypothetical protein CMB31_07065 [Euryarchaeota archaeon]|nr:hypothetical protein [Euryarchaeota archaeon]